MTLKIRLRQQGRTNHHTYRLVVTDAYSPRDGKYVENLGYYNPHCEGTQESSLVEERIHYWIERGAQPTEKALSLIERKAPGVIKMMREKALAKQKKRSEKRRAKRESRS